MREAQEAVLDYLHFLRVERQYSENTLASYRRDLEDYIEHLHTEQKVEHLNDVDRSRILLYLEHLRNNGKSSRTIARHISSIRSFHQFLLREKITNHDPTVHLDMPHIEKTLPKVLSLAEVEALIQAPDQSKPQGIRDVAMIELLYGTGMRISECIELNLDDVHLTMGFVRIYGKGGKERIVPLGKSALFACERYLKEARHLLQGKYPKTDAFFY